MTAPLWTVAAMQAAMEAGVAARGGPVPHCVSGISIDSRTVKPGEAFFAIRGDTHDGHDFVAAALRAGAALAVVAQDQGERFGDNAPLLLVGDVLAALRGIAVAARARSAAKIVAVTGSVGKTSTKEALALALGSDGQTHASAASFNNHWGVPLSLASLPQSARYGVFEIGMNHAGEIAPLTRMVRPHAAVVTAVEAVHLEFFRSVAAIADAKAEIFVGVEPVGATVLNRDNRYFSRLRRRAEEAGVGTIVSFGASPRADARLVTCSLHPDCTTVEAKICGVPVTYEIGAPGRHLAINSLAVLAVASLLGADLVRAALALAHQQPAAGRGTRIMLELPYGGSPALLIDESYNANPTSMRAALALLGQAPVGPPPGGRRIAVLGDMLELGRSGEALHRDLAEAVHDNAIDLVYCAGPLIRALWRALPTGSRGFYADSAAELTPHVLAAVRGGDAVMVKASAGLRFGTIVQALASRYSPPPSPGPKAPGPAPAQG